MREHSGLSRREFGKLFHSRESTVCEWENGHCIPRMLKLMNISVYFGVSLDCILSGKATGESMLEEILSKVDEAEPSEPVRSYYAGQFIAQFNSLPNKHKERLIGYLDALGRENGNRL